MLEAFIGGIAAWIAVFLLVMFAGRSEPTHHGQIIIFQIALVAGLVVAVVIWLGGAAWWLLT